MALDAGSWQQKCTVCLWIGTTPGGKMKVRNGLALLALGIFGATSAFAGPTSFNFNFAPPSGTDMELGTTANYASNGATITAYGYECTATNGSSTATDASSTATLSSCAASDLYEKNDSSFELGLGLAGEEDHEIGLDPSGDFVMGLNLSNLLSLGVKDVTLTFGSVEPGEAFAALGYSSNPFLAGTPFVLTNTKAWFGNNGSFGDVDSATFDLNSNDDFLVLIAPCGADLGNPTGANGGCGSNVTLVGAAGTTTPEPGTIALFVTGLAMLGFATRKRWATQQT